MRSKWFEIRFRVGMQWRDASDDNLFKLISYVRSQVKGKEFVIGSITIRFPYKEFNKK